MRNSLLLTLAPLLAVAAYASEPEDPRLWEESENVREQKEKAIREELKELGNHEWAGRYYAREGVSLDLAPKAGFLLELHGCFGVMDFNYGEIKRSGNRIRLEFVRKNHLNHICDVSGGVVPVRWGARHYLIPADDFAPFLGAVNRRQESRDSGLGGSFFLRRGDDKLPAPGLPDVPQEYKKYLRAR